MSSNNPIPGLYQGVSQQAPALRSLEQCQASENCYATVADGLRRRPPTQRVATLSTDPLFFPKVHQYFRGDGEHKIISVLNSAGLIKAWDGETGTLKTIDTSTYAGVLSYITDGDPQKNIGMLTVADTTFIWNRSKTVAMKASTLTAQVPTLYVYIKQAQANANYSISLTPGIAAYSAGSSVSTTAAAGALKTAVSALSGFTCSQFGNLLVIKRIDNADFPYEVYDDAGGNLMVGLKNRVERYSDLPRMFAEGASIEVRGQGDTGGKSSFWVQWKKNAGFQTGYWEETVSPTPGEQTDLDDTTMPLELVRNSDDTFTLKRVVWGTRLVGNIANVPPPSFVGKKINSMFFWRGRLGILSDENVIMSRSGNLFNFWPKSASVVADDDPIDESVNSQKVATLRHAVPFQRTCVLFSDTTQFILSAGTSDILTPRTFHADPATDFDSSSLCTPVSSGEDLFFVYERSSNAGGNVYSGVREYFVNQQASTNDAVDVTSHIPQYIPSQVIGASVSSTEDVLLLWNRNGAIGEYKNVYWYKYLWDGDKRIQSAWGRWTFRPSDGVLSASVNKTTVYFVIMRADGVYLERMELQSSATTSTLPFQLHLDSLAVVPLEAMEGYSNGQTFLLKSTLPPLDPSQGEYVFVAGPDFGTRSGAVIAYKSEVEDGDFFLKGNWTVGTIYYGVRYASKYTFSQLFERDRNGLAMTSGRLQVKYMTVNFKNTFTFRAEVETASRDTSVYRYSGLKIGMAGSLIGTIIMRDGSFTFPVASDATRATISLVNDSPYPSTFYSGEWDGLYTQRTPRQ